LPFSLKIWAPRKEDQFKKRVKKSRTTVPLSDTSDCIGYGIVHILIPILSLRLYRQISTDTSNCIGWYWGFWTFKAIL